MKLLLTQPFIAREPRTPIALMDLETAQTAIMLD
jgi:hypothetical protein